MQDALIRTLFWVLSTYSGYWTCCTMNVWTVLWLFSCDFLLIPNHFWYCHRTSGTKSSLTSSMTFALPVSLLVILEVMLTGQLCSGIAISLFSGYTWNELNAAKYVVRPEKKTWEEEKSQGDHSWTAWPKWFSKAEETNKPHFHAIYITYTIAFSAGLNVLQVDQVISENDSRTCSCTQL